ncbi:hypothetical protein JX265_008353 [Neoarthrinium moseri]|uniref:Tat pathway signal sequence n=1 Tax=Neoarthrinium moseri TaxID=1658444 RepID=A0A9P9WI31_9PEZI|nr:hypothetical protein JX266_008855 [Neoarthrinium moseri]KAI1864629.1 hypothetical protein JX265_008353 [Neoarthrinium moseri]
MAANDEVVMNDLIDPTTKASRSMSSEGERLMSQDEETFMEDDHIASRFNRSNSLKRSLRYSLFANSLLLFIVMMGTVVWVTDGWPFTWNMSLRRNNPYSPWLDEWKFDFHDDEINGTMWDLDSIFRQLPGNPEGDAEWERVTALSLITFKAEQLKKMGRNPREAAKVPPEWGHGDDEYVASLDVQHLLHCLWRLRAYIFFPYYFEPDLGPGSNTMNMPWQHKAHCLHCLDVILQDLRCRPNVVVNTWEFIDGAQRPFVDVRNKVQCVNHNAILDWQKKKTYLSMEDYQALRSRPDSVFQIKPVGVDPQLDNLEKVWSE